MTHCSVSDDFVAFTVRQEFPEAAPASHDEFQVNAPKSGPVHVKIVLIDVKRRCETVLKNPSESEITAIYVDESILMVGSGNSAYALNPVKLFHEQAEATQ